MNDEHERVLCFLWEIKFKFEIDQNQSIACLCVRVFRFYFYMGKKTRSHDCDRRLFYDNNRLFLSLFTWKWIKQKFPLNND